MQGAATAGRRRPAHRRPAFVKFVDAARKADDRVARPRFLEVGETVRHNASREIVEDTSVDTALRRAAAETTVESSLTLAKARYGPCDILSPLFTFRGQAYANATCREDAEREYEPGTPLDSGY